ncbi:MAG: AbrB/MazE/SpoVT family DNA-binding domain-containing protein [Treponemataceae bacterium]|nr:MAG: AbrB/MazE/SpoVT family DNA-binding domain-containing protein [Treponemataceae bacterium]
MEAVIRKWGNSLGIRIPRLIARQLSLKDGSCVDIKDTGSEIIIQPRKKTRLAGMLGKINSKNIHAEVETAEPIGNEIW